MPQAIFFDLDETLIRHSASIMDQLQTICKQHLGELSDARWDTFNKHLMANVGQLWNNVADHQGRCQAEFTNIFRSGLVDAGGDGALAEPIVEAFLDAVVETTGPTDGAHELLDQLADIGIPTGIITNGFSFLQKRKVLAHGFADRVRAVVTSEDAGAHKPDARIFRLAMERVGITSTDCWHVGDNRDADIAGAIGAGFSALWYVPEPKPSDEVPSPTTSFRVIRRLAEISELIGKSA